MLNLLVAGLASITVMVLCGMAKYHRVYRHRKLKRCIVPRFRNDTIMVLAIIMAGLTAVVAVKFAWGWIEYSLLQVHKSYPVLRAMFVIPMWTALFAAFLNFIGKFSAMLRYAYLEYRQESIRKKIHRRRKKAVKKYEANKPAVARMYDIRI